MEGYFSISREITADLMRLSSNDVKLYVYMVYRAAYREGRFCKVGELMDSVLTLSKATHLSRQQTRTSLKNLEKFSFIAKNQPVNQPHNQPLFSITGYINPAIANHKPNQLSNHSLTTDQPQPNHSLTTLEEVRREEGKKEINTTYVQNEFERVWARYPKRRGKKAALRHYLASVKSAEDVQAVHVALDAYLAEIKAKGSDLQYVQNGSTWFNDWQSFKDQPKPNLSAPKQTQGPPAIESWRIVPKDEDLVDPSEIHHLITSLRSGNGFKGAS